MSVIDAASAGVHVREQHSVLAGAEKRALIWIARRLPPSINSDHLTALALVSMATAGISFAGLRFTDWAATGVVTSLAANWFGDSLDGTLARVRGHQRPRYGFYVDHVIDVAGAAFLLIGLACSGVMDPLLALSLLGAYLLVAAESFLATHAAGVFRMSFLGVGPTELRIVLAAGALKVAHSPWISVGIGAVRLFDLGGIIAIVGLVVVFVVSAVRNTRALHAQEPLPSRDVPRISWRDVGRVLWTRQSSPVRPFDKLRVVPSEVEERKDPAYVPKGSTLRGAGH